MKASDGLGIDAAGIARCAWCMGDPEYQRYHDEEWGRLETDDRRLFEQICLEGFQCGLSWLTILRKRTHFRRAFADFDFDQLASFGTKDVERLMQDPGIVRHRGKIQACLQNAGRARCLRDEWGSLSAYFKTWLPETREPHAGSQPWPYPVPGMTRTSIALARDLRKRGWAFVGPTTVYAFMQSTGLVNDHLPGCHCYTDQGRIVTGVPTDTWLKI